MTKPTHVRPGQVWKWDGGAGKKGTAESVTVDRLERPTEATQATVLLTYLAAFNRPVPEEADPLLVRFKERPGVQVDLVLLNDPRWIYLGGAP